MFIEIELKKWDIKLVGSGGKIPDPAKKSGSGSTTLSER